MTLTSKEAQEKVESYFDKVQAARMDQESKLDAALLAIIGGALTVSAAFVPSMMEKNGHVLIDAGWLLTSWIVWAVALAVHLIGYTLSIRANRLICERLAAQKFTPSELHPTWGRWIERITWLVMVLTVCGFIAFGVFAFRNLDHEVTNGQGMEKSKEESIQDSEASARQRPPGTGSVLPVAPKKEADQVTPAQ
jgi:hypothetical protein